MFVLTGDAMRHGGKERKRKILSRRGWVRRMKEHIHVVVVGELHCIKSSSVSEVAIENMSIAN